MHDPELEELLATDPEAFDDPIKEALREPAALVLYGAGRVGKNAVQRLRGAGVTVLGFVDDTIAPGEAISGIPVLDLEKVLSAAGDEVVVVVTMLNPRLPFLRAKRRLHGKGVGRVVSIFHLARCFPEAFLPFFQVDSPARVLADRDRIREAMKLFEDPRSRREYVQHLRFRLGLEFAELPAPEAAGYFLPGIAEFMSSDTAFVDCGAYDGDTIRHFLAVQGDRFSRILAVEPDPANYSRLEAYVDGLPDALRSRITLVAAAVGAESGVVRFDARGDVGSCIHHQGADEVPLARLDDLVSPEFKSLFLKLDIEGAEAEALRGATTTLGRGTSVLAVSIYHAPDHLWSLPLQMHEVLPNHRLLLRTLGTDGADVICFATPRADSVDSGCR